MSSSPHRLKTINPYFLDLWYREKTAELRLDDRGFAVGDKLILTLWDKKTGWSTKSVHATISHILGKPEDCASCIYGNPHDYCKPPAFMEGLKSGYVILSLTDMTNVDEGLMPQILPGMYLVGLIVAALILALITIAMVGAV